MKKIRWVLPVLAAIPLFAVTPQFWEIRTYDDFRKGKLTNLSLTSDDELILAPRFDMVFNTEQTLIASAVADSKGNLYLGTGHDGKIYKVDAAGKGAMLVDLAELDVLALAVDSKDVLYAGTSPNGKVYKIEHKPGGKTEAKTDSKSVDKDAPKDATKPVLDASWSSSVYFAPGTKYVWDLLLDKQMLQEVLAKKA